MSWILITILAYFFLALSSLADRYLLAGPLPSPKAYACLVGLLGIFALILSPLGLEIPDLNRVFVYLLAGAIWIFDIFFLYTAIIKSEVSRVVPAIGGLLPIFTLLISLIAFPGQIQITLNYIFVLVLLISGTVLISLEKKSINTQALKYASLSALASAIGFLLMKKVYLEQTFISGFIWMRLGGFLAGLIFLGFQDVHQAIFYSKKVLEKHTSIPFVLGQACGGFGFLLQNLAVAWSEINQLPFINALEGTRYMFLLFLVFALGRKFPQILKEETSKSVFFQKIFATLIVGLGLALLAFK